MKKIKAILIHGTFDPDADWDDCREDDDKPNFRKRSRREQKDGDSDFVASLRQQLAERGVELAAEAFQWSGGNSHHVRRSAALRLNRRINRIDPETECPDGLFMIGHSHGGTVARLAVNMPTNFAPKGVITFGSPFVRFMPRPVRWFMAGVLWTFRAVAFLLLLLVLTLSMLAWLSVIGPPDMLIGYWPTRTQFLLGLAIYIGALYLIDRWLRNGRRTLFEVQGMLRERFDPEDDSGTGYLNFHTRLDEAGLLLRFWSMPTALFHTLISTLVNTSFIVVISAVAAFIYLLHSLFYYLYSMIDRDLAAHYELTRVYDIAGAFHGYAGWVVSVVETYVFAPILSVMIWITGIDLDEVRVSTYELYQAFPAGLIVAGIILIAVLFVATLLLAPVAIFLPWFFRKLPIAFGGERVSWSIASDISVVRRARNDAEIVSVDLSEAWRRRPWIFRHNFFYHAPQVITEVADRLADWQTTPRQLLNWEGFLFGSVRVLFQLATLVAFILLALLITVELPNLFAETTAG